jgi:hypothetical protein
MIHVSLAPQLECLTFERQLFAHPVQRLFGLFHLLCVVLTLTIKQRAFLSEFRDPVAMCVDLGCEDLLAPGDVLQNLLGLRELSLHLRRQFRWPGRRCQRGLVVRELQLTTVMLRLPLGARVRRVRGLYWRPDPGLHISIKLGKMHLRIIKTFGRLFAFHDLRYYVQPAFTGI